MVPTALGKFFDSYKGRQIPVGERVEVYRNLKFKDRVVYSIRDRKSGLVLGHASNLLLSDCYFVVKEAGRKRVLKEKKKNVHAWIEGSFGVIHAGDDRIFSEGIRVKYNPYQNQTFVREYEEGETSHILWANVVWIDEMDVVASGL